MVHRSKSAAHAQTVREVAQSDAAGRSAFAASWRRSLLHHRIDPERGDEVHRLDPARQRERAEAAGLLLSIANPVLDRLARAAGDAGCAVFLTDSDGLILAERMRAADSGWFQGAGLTTGSDWSEGAEGTNGIGTSAAEARPVIVLRDQHFRARNTELACMGAPIFGAEGDLAGVIDVSSTRDDLTEGYARLISLTVQDAAQRIEGDLFRASFDGARILSVGAGESAPQGVMLLALDRDDLLIGATRAARRHLGLTAKDVGHVSADDLFGSGEAASLSRAQRAEMARVLARHHGNVSAAARELGIGRATFYRKAKSLGLDV